jgi:hypothetical protein
MFGKAITYKTTTKCLADNRAAKYEASVGPAENLPPSVWRSDEFQKLCGSHMYTNVWILDKVIYGSRMYTNVWILDKVIYGSRMYTNVWILDKVI